MSAPPYFRLAALSVLLPTLFLVLSRPVLGNLYKVNFGAQWQFLTVIGLALTVLVVGMSAMEGTGRFKGHTYKRALEHLKAAVFAIDLLITTFYWSCYFVMPGALIPKEFIGKIPVFFDIGLHLVPAVVMFCEFILFTPQQVFQKSHVFTIAAIGVAYGLWIHWCFHLNGYWVYPFLAMMGQSQRVGSLTLLLSLAIGFYFLGLFASEYYHQPALLKTLKQSVRSPKAVLQSIGAKATPRGRKASTKESTNSTPKKSARNNTDETRSPHRKSVTRGTPRKAASEDGDSPKKPVVEVTKSKLATETKAKSTPKSPRAKRGSSPVSKSRARSPSAKASGKAHAETSPVKRKTRASSKVSDSG